MKRILNIILLSSAIALPATAQAAAKNGWYAGIVTGYSHTDMDIEAGPVGAGPTQFEQANIHAGEFGFVGGYEHDLPNNFFVGGEVEGLVAFGDKNGLLAENVDIEKTTSFGLYVKPGYRIDARWSGFATLGMQWVGYELRNPAAGYKEDDTEIGFLIGAGVDYKLDEDVSLALEYNRVQPLDVKYQYVPGAVDSRFDPELDIVKMALKYHF